MRAVFRRALPIILFATTCFSATVIRGPWVPADEKALIESLRLSKKIFPPEAEAAFEASFRSFDNSQEFHEQTMKALVEAIVSKETKLSVRATILLNLQTRAAIGQLPQELALQIARASTDSVASSIIFYHTKAHPEQLVEIRKAVLENLDGLTKSMNKSSEALSQRGITESSQHIQVFSLLDYKDPKTLEVIRSWYDNRRNKPYLLKPLLALSPETYFQTVSPDYFVSSIELNEAAEIRNLFEAEIGNSQGASAAAESVRRHVAQTQKSKLLATLDEAAKLNNFMHNAGLLSDLDKDILPQLALTADEDLAKVLLKKLDSPEFGHSQIFREKLYLTLANGYSHLPEVRKAVLKYLDIKGINNTSTSFRRSLSVAIPHWPLDREEASIALRLIPPNTPGIDTRSYPLPIEDEHIRKRFIAAAMRAQVTGTCIPDYSLLAPR